jgi:hypothetical protein
MSFHTNLVDADWILHAASHSGEKKTIKAIEKQSGNEYDLKSRTELWGRKKSRDGGFLAELNKSRTTLLTWEDFDIIDVQTPEEISNVLHTVKMMVQGVAKSTGVERTKLFVGEGKSFRYDRATLLEYKGTRTHNLIPVHKDAVKEYLIKHHGAEVITDLEVDDWVVCLGQEKGNLVVSVDKDSMGCPIDLFNPMHPEWGIMDCRGLGKLWWDTTGKQKKLRGIGRKWLYTQCLIGDPVDAISPTAASTLEFGEVSAFNALSECTSDLECFKIMKDVYQKMYPKMVRVHHWNSTEDNPIILNVDWRYALNEVWDLVRMRRSVDDIVTAQEVFTKHGLWN